MKNFIITVAITVSLMSATAPAYSDETLSADQIKALINGKTIHVTVIKNGKTWNMYHAPDGTSHDSRGGTGKWNVTDDGQHCNESPKVKAKCGKVVSKGDGTYIRTKLDGTPLVTWTDIVDGKNF